MKRPRKRQGRGAAETTPPTVNHWREAAKAIGEFLLFWLGALVIIVTMNLLWLWYGPNPLAPG